MGTFTKWLRRRGKIAEDFDPVDKFSSNSETPRDYEKDCQDLTKTLVSKYSSEFFQFVKQLSDENGDKELAELLEKAQLEKESPSGNWQPDHSRDVDDVSMPKADRGIDPNQGG